MLKVAVATEIGGLNGANPLKLSMPVMIAPMSYGALSASTKRAVGLASILSGIAENTGEGRDERHAARSVQPDSIASGGRHRGAYRRGPAPSIDKAHRTIRSIAEETGRAGKRT